MNNKKGFTLIEVVIAMFVTTILLAAVYFMFVRVFEMNLDQSQYIEAQDTLRTVSQIVESDVRRSTQFMEVEESSGVVTLKFLVNKKGVLEPLKDDAGNQVKMTYELKDEVLYRNSQRLMDRVNEFELTKVDSPEGDYLNLIIISETKTREVRHEKKIYLRQN